MRFVSSIISVKDINASRKFYEDIFKLKVENASEKYVAFTCGFIIQQDFKEIVGIVENESLERNVNFGMSFEDEDLDAFVETLKQHTEIEYLHELREFAWGQRVIRFYDVDNTVIEVRESMISVIKRLLKEGKSVEDTANTTQYSVDFVSMCAE